MLSCLQVLVTDDIAGLTAAAQWGTGRGAAAGQCVLSDDCPVQRSRAAGAPGRETSAPSATAATR